jgi:purine catabolism regulator
LNLYPIFTHRHEGYLISLHGKQARSRLGELAIEQAANALSMAMTKKHAEQERYLRYKTEFFSTLLNGSSLPEGELYEQARQYGLTELYPLLPIAAMNDELSSPDKRSGMIDDNLQWSSRDAHYELLHTHFEKLSLPFVIFTKNDSIVILLHIGSLAWDEPAFARQLAELGEQLYMQSSFSVSFGVGKPASGLQELRSSYKEAVNALQAGYQMKSKRFVQTCHTKDINRLLLMIPIDERKQFYEETFKDLLKKERAEQNELMKTLYIFHKNHCQIIETAKQLFIHRNTVIYRQDKSGLPLLLSLFYRQMG